MAAAASALHPIRVLVADDHALFRRGVVLVLEVEPDMEVAGEAHDGIEAVDMAVGTRPDVVLLDVRMPGLSGIDACARIHVRVPDARIVMLSGSDAGADLAASVRAGAAGYLLKDLHVAEIAAAVRGAHGGQTPLAPSLAARAGSEPVPDRPWTVPRRRARSTSTPTWPAAPAGGST